jgi:hypothetical protein
MNVPFEIEARKDQLDFKHLPLLARCILDCHFDEFLDFQMSRIKILQVPLLKVYEQMMSPEQLKALSISSNKEYLQSLADNKAADQLIFSLNNYQQNQLPLITNKQIAFKDIILVSAIRKESLLQFIPKCFDNINDILATVAEIDSLMLTGNELSTTLYEELMMEQLHSEIYFSSKLMETSPGFNYIYNLKADQPLQVHNELFKYLGYDEAAFEGNKMFFPQIIHPDDA